jgi:hypothetical protein
MNSRAPFPQAFFVKENFPPATPLHAGVACRNSAIIICPAMKTSFLRLLALAALGSCFALSPLPCRAQAEGQPVQEESDEDSPPFDAEEYKKQMKEKEKAANTEIKKMLRVFKPLEGEWSGKEKVEHEAEPFKAFDKEWGDVWKGFFTTDGRYFEMTGQTDGEDSAGYRWVCTWVPSEECYKAWYFGETVQTLYTGELSSNGKYVIWSREDEEGETETQFEMVADGDRVKCSGTDRMAGRVFSRQSSSYTRKKVEL